MRRSLLTLGGAATIVAGTVAGAQTTCLTEAEARSVAAFALPAAVEAVARRCRPALPADAFLVRQGAALADRYRAQGGGDIRAATAVIQRFAGSGLSDLLDPASAALAAEDAVADRITAIVGTRDCPGVSRVIEQVSPLPLGNVAALVVALIRLDRGRTVRTGLTLCPSTPAAGAR